MYSCLLYTSRGKAQTAEQVRIDNTVLYSYCQSDRSKHLFPTPDTKPDKRQTLSSKNITVECFIKQDNREHQRLSLQQQ